MWKWIRHELRKLWREPKPMRKEIYDVLDAARLNPSKWKAEHHPFDGSEILGNPALGLYFYLDYNRLITNVGSLSLNASEVTYLKESFEYIRQFEIDKSDRNTLLYLDELINGIQKNHFNS